MRPCSVSIENSRWRVKEKYLCIFGENWSKTDDATWRLLQAQGGLKSDPDLGRCNRGITVVLL